MPYITRDRKLTAGFEHEAVYPCSVSAVRGALEAVGIDWVKVEHEHAGMAEVVFPAFLLPLNEDNPAWHEIKLALDTLDGLGANVSRSGCGGHVHIGRQAIEGQSAGEYWEESKAALRASRHRNNATFYSSPNEVDDMPLALLKDVIRRYAIHQDVIDAHLPPSRTNCTWARGMQRLANNDRFENATAETIVSVVHSDGTKYQAINLRNLDGGTIEFRQGSATNEVKKLAAWVNLIDAMFRHSDRYRIDYGTSGASESVVQSPARLHRAGSRLDVTYQLCRREGGASVHEIMTATGCTAQRIRAMITEIRQHADMSDDMVETLTQQHYNHRYGSSLGRYDQGGYEIRREITRAGAACHALLPENRIGQTSIFSGLDDDSFETLSARRLQRIRQGTLDA